MANKFTGARLSLDPHVTGILAAFSRANYNAPAVNIVREAVREYVQRRLEADPELRARYDMARAKRLNTHNLGG